MVEVGRFCHIRFSMSIFRIVFGYKITKKAANAKSISTFFEGK
jgi:hypothetical protein